MKEYSKLSPSLGGTQDPARASGSSISEYTSAKSSPVVPTVDKDDVCDVSQQEVNDIPIQHIDPSVEYREQARKIHEGDEEFVSRAGAAAWLGESGSERAAVRKAYMDFYDWADLNILSALRVFCGKLILKGETQQVDRILDAFSTRWCICNPDHGFKATGRPPIAQRREYKLIIHSRCRSHHLLLYHPTQHRPALGRD